VNVGDIKPVELPTQFFPRLRGTRALAGRAAFRVHAALGDTTFGAEHATEIADIVTTYSTSTGVEARALSPDTYSLTNYREAETVVAE
jgi:hypothetical protein